MENLCMVCGQVMSRARDLKRHIATVHRSLFPDLAPLKPKSEAGSGCEEGGGSPSQRAPSSTITDNPLLSSALDGTWNLHDHEPSSSFPIVTSSYSTHGSAPAENENSNSSDVMLEEDYVNMNKKKDSN
jgi:hypothetical protein